MARFHQVHHQVLSVVHVVPESMEVTLSTVTITAALATLDGILLVDI